MRIETETVAPGVTRASLIGRMDIKGAGAIDLHFSALIGSQRALIIDMTQVEFIASMGLRTLIMGARTVSSKRGRMVLLNPIADVEEVLRTAGVDAVVGIVRTLDEAIQSVSG